MEDEDRPSSLLNYIHDLSTINADHVESVTHTFLANPVRFVYFNNDEPEIEPIIIEEENEDDNQKFRGRHPETWRQNVRKRNKNQGLEYVKANGEVSAKKEMGPPCTCKMKCYVRIGDEACKKVFSNFWKLGDYSLQNAYIAGCVRIFLPKQYSKNRSETLSHSRRFYTRFFYVNVNGVDTEICKQAFLNLHSISNGRLDRLLKKKQEAGNTGIDARGRHNNKVNKVPIEKIRDVRRNIDGFRKRAGFTGKRKSRSVEILHGPLNIRSMYKEYSEEVIAKGQKPVCEFRYRKIFRNDFHIEFARPSVNSTPGQNPTVVAPKPILLHIESIHPSPVHVETERSNMKSEMAQQNLTFTVEDKPIYTTLETKDAASNTNGYQTYNPDLFSSCTLSQQNWIFPTQT